MLVLDNQLLGFSPPLRSLARMEPMMFVSGVFRCGSSLPMSDLSQLGSSTFVRSFGCPDLLVPVTGMG